MDNEALELVQGVLDTLLAEMIISGEYEHQVNDLHRALALLNANG